MPNSVSPAPESRTVGSELQSIHEVCESLKSAPEPISVESAVIVSLLSRLTLVVATLTLTMKNETGDEELKKDL